MKTTILALLPLLIATLLATGCELSTQTDDTSLTITDGTVSSFQTQQGNVTITAPGNSSNTLNQR
jgi:hypothetical protein